MSKFARRTARWLTRLRRRFYLLNDTFTTDLAAGAVNGTSAEPGPGTRAVVDTGSKAVLSSGRLVVASAAPGSGNPLLTYAAHVRSPGRFVKVEITPVSGASPARVGWNSAQGSGFGSDTLRFNASGVLGTTIGASESAQVGTWTAASYEVIVITRVSGLTYFIKGGAFTNWTLLWIANAGTTTPLYPVIAAVNAGAGFSSDYIRSPELFWLPSPLLSDGFGATFGLSDGLGHAEGVAEGRGRGGDGLPYTQGGTWANASGTASSTVLSGGTSSFTYAACGSADVIATVKFTRAGGDGGLLLRYADGNNFITCRHDGTNVLLIKKVANVNTTVQTTVVTYAAGAELRVIATGSAFRVYYNNALVGTEQTIADAALQTPANHGLYTTNVGNTFDDLVIYARGTGGEYAALDAV